MWQCISVTVVQRSWSGLKVAPGIHHYPNIYLLVSHTVIMGNSAVLLEQSPQFSKGWQTPVQNSVTLLLVPKHFWFMLCFSIHTRNLNFEHINWDKQLPSPPFYCFNYQFTPILNQFTMPSLNRDEIFVNESMINAPVKKV